MKRKPHFDASENSGRYIASGEFADLRGVPAVPVSFRAALLLSAAKRDFIWWLQGLSLTEGGFRCLARELLEMFPERFDAEDAGQLLTPQWRNQSPLYVSEYNYRKLSIPEFLVELCINPKMTFTLLGVDLDCSELETQIARENGHSDFCEARLDLFRGIIGALVEYRARAEKAVRDNFYLTEIGRQIWDTLDFGLRTRGMVLVYGREGRGKTEAVKAWAQLHGGQTRFASLKGITTKTAMFRELSRALGITQSYKSAGWEMQARIEDVLKRSKIMLVIDEAHFLFNQSQRTKSRPELIDWLNTAVSNCQIPLGLCTTPQFMDCMARAAYQVEWNYNQFRRRVKRWIPLPEENTESDIAGVAAKVFAGANSAVVKKVISYVFSSGRDLSALGDVATELRELLGTADFSKATFKQVDQIISENLYPSDNAFLTQMEIARQRLPKGRKQAPPAIPLAADQEGEFESGEENIMASCRIETHPTGTPARHRRPGSARAETGSGMPDRAGPEAILMAH